MVRPDQIDAIVRYGEHKTSKNEVFSSLSQNVNLVKDAAVFSAEVYYRGIGKSAPTSLPPKNYQWVKFESIPEFVPPRSTIILKGLYFEVWYTAGHNGNKIAAIVFRGTRFTMWQDWYSNCRWLTKFIPGVFDHYRQINALAKKIVDSLKKELGSDIKIIAAGHSLGGGLAQHAAYSASDISDVFAFNPSPVTGFYSIPKSTRENNSEKLRILRIYEHGEILAYLRLVLRPFYPLTYSKPSIIEVRFNFSRADSITEHGMERFAHGLHSIAGRL